MPFRQTWVSYYPRRPAVDGDGSGDGGNHVLDDDGDRGYRREKVDAKMLLNGLNTCGIATTICGFFNLFPYAAFAQNVGLIGLTGVRSRFVVSVSASF